MKYCLLLIILFGFLEKGTAQSSGGNVFQSGSIYTGSLVNGSDVVLPAYNVEGGYDGNPYFSKDWVKGAVTSLDSQVYSNKLLFMFDKTTGTLYFKNEDSAAIMEAD